MFYIFLSGYNSRTVQDTKVKFSAFLSFVEATKGVKFQSARCTLFKVGILWICFKTKGAHNSMCFYACVYYLPPQESSRIVDPINFFDTLLGQTHLYVQNAWFYVCGDFNSRSSNFKDFITGIDDIPERHMTDFTPNKYGQHFCEFLIDANCCILNGRQNFIKNNYTFVAPT